MGPSYQNLSCGSVTWHELGEIVGRGGGAVPWGVGTAVGGGTEAVVVAAGAGAREDCGDGLLDRLGAGGAIAEGVDATFSGAPSHAVARTIAIATVARRFLMASR